MSELTKEVATMSRRLLSASSLSIAVASAALAQSSLVAVDGVGNTLGEVLSISSWAVGGANDALLYRCGADCGGAYEDQFLAIPINRDEGLVWSEVWFESSVCDDQAWTPWWRNAPAWSAFRVGVLDRRRQLFVLERGTPVLTEPSVPTLGSHFNELGACVAETPPPAPDGWVSVFEIGPAPDSPPPISYILNPSVHFDGVQQEVPRSLSQNPLLAIDGPGTVLGEVLSITTWASHGESDALLYRYDSDEFVVIPMTRNNGLITNSVWFEGTTCQGQAWIDRYLNAPAFSPYPVGVLDRNRRLYRLDRGSAPQFNPPIGSKIDFLGACVVAAAPNGQYVPISVLDPFGMGQSPVRYVLNPSIFWDQFQAGDFTRWSNY